MGADNTDRLSGLHKERLVIGEVLERATDRVERIPVPRRFARAAVHDELFRVLGHLWVQVVAKHPQSGFLHPSAAAQGVAARC